MSIGARELVLNMLVGGAFGVPLENGNEGIVGFDTSQRVEAELRETAILFVFLRAVDRV